MGNTTQKQTYAEEQDDNRRVAPMGRTPRKKRTINDDIYVIGKQM